MDAFVSGAWRTAKRAEVLINGNWRQVTRAECYLNGQWRTILSFASPLSVSSYDVDGVVYNRKPALVTSRTATATPTGGTGPYSYSWIITSGGATVVSPNMATTAFREVIPPGEYMFSTARVTCTDVFGTVATADITITLSNEGSL